MRQEVLPFMCLGIKHSLSILKIPLDIRVLAPFLYLPFPAETNGIPVVIDVRFTFLQEFIL